MCFASPASGTLHSSVFASSQMLGWRVGGNRTFSYRFAPRPADGAPQRSVEAVNCRNAETRITALRACGLPSPTWRRSTVTALVAKSTAEETSASHPVASGGPCTADKPHEVPGYTAPVAAAGYTEAPVARLAVRRRTGSPAAARSPLEEAAPAPRCSRAAVGHSQVVQQCLAEGRPGSQEERRSLEGRELMAAPQAGGRANWHAEGPPA